MDIGTRYGKLGRVGVISPFGPEVAVTDFNRYLHPDIQVAEMQIPMRELSPDGLREMSRKAIVDACLFKQYGPIDFALFSCTSGSLIGGMGYDRTLCRELMAASGATEACTTTTAVLQALRALQSRRISLITPYPEDVNAAEKAYLENEGFSVLNVDAIETQDPRNSRYIAQLTPEQIYSFALRHVDPKADTLFLSCTGLTAFTIIEALEQRLSIPVVTSNQSAAWMIGKFFGRHGPLAVHFGKLFTL